VDEGEVMGDFAPWSTGTAHRSGDTIHGMLMLKQEAGLKLVETEIVHDGQGLMFVFEVIEKEN
jgi:hypothetical protein